MVHPGLCRSRQETNAAISPLRARRFGRDDRERGLGLHDPKPLRGFAGLVGGAVFGVVIRRWRAASYITTAPATETLSEETLPAMGMRSKWSQVRFTRSCSPEPSLPRTR